MKIGILTQPLHNNYGGLLQAYALQSYLKKQGHVVLTVDFFNDNKSQLFWVRSVAYNVIKKYILRRPIFSILPFNEKMKKYVEQHTNRFIAENIKTTQAINSLSEFDYLKHYNFDAYIIGSDQVWRPAYSHCMPVFFLNFLGNDKNIKRIAYAASFGLDHCDEFEKDELPYYASLLKQFDAVGVREDSGIGLCHDYFGVAAKHVIDPTLLIDKSEYCALVERDNIPVSVGNMMVYMLDKTPVKQRMIELIAKERGLQFYTVMQDEVTGIYPPVTQWLRGFMDAEYVVTDSFHGVAFSIIFNKPFIAIGNHGRGLARFTSILSKFGLQDRLVFPENELTSEIINHKIDFDNVNKLKKVEQEFSKTFLQKVLKERLNN